MGEATVVQAVPFQRANSSWIVCGLAVGWTVQIEPVAPRDSCAVGTNVQTSTGPVCGIVNNGVSEWRCGVAASVTGLTCLGPPRQLRLPRRAQFAADRGVIPWSW